MFDTFQGFFVTGVGTGVGKTFVTRGLTRALQRHGHAAWALKPLETGVAPDPADAIALARCSDRPELASLPGLYRAAPPLAPYAATLAGEAPPPPLPQLLATIRAALHGARVGLVEGAGGLLVPLDAQHSMADLARALGYPLLLVAPNRLGVLSDVLTCAQAAAAAQLSIAAVILTGRARSADDPSPRTNARILGERMQLPIVQFPECADDDDRLADAALLSGLLSALRLDPRRV